MMIDGTWIRRTSNATLERAKFVDYTFVKFNLFTLGHT